ncbi:hypothetical protein FOA52_006364 [Chlamydomonas sp. UWO 241]|nr:hypothetical protein FOA52_006364 [Chlamydomonas sp. UWO 241]
MAPPMVAVPPPGARALLEETALPRDLPPIPREFAQLREVAQPAFYEETLPNGLRVLLLEDHEVPLVRGTLMMRGGKYASPPDKVGVATLTAAVQRAGGSRAHTGDEMDARLEDLAAGIEFNAGSLSTAAGFQCLSGDLREVVGLMSEVVRAPAWSGDKLSLFREQVVSMIDHQNDNPSAIANRLLLRQMYGPDSVYARQATKKGVASIGVEDLQSFAATWQRPETAVLGLVGDFEPRAAMTIVKDAFGAWEGGAPAQAVAGAAVPKGRAMDSVPRAYPAWWDEDDGGSGGGRGEGSWSSSSAEGAIVSSVRGSGGGGGASPLGRVFVVDVPGLAQATVVSAEPGVKLLEPDSYPLEVLSGIYNGFGGKLFNAIRSRQGLAYSVSASWDPPLDHRGLFVASAQTSDPGALLAALRVQLLPSAPPLSATDAGPPPAAAAPAREGGADGPGDGSAGGGASPSAVAAALKASDAASSPGASWPAEADVNDAKERYLNAFVFNYTSKAQQMQRVMVCELLGLPRDLLSQLQRGVAAVTADDVAAAAARRLHPTAQAVVVVGDGKAVTESLRAAGFNDLTPLALPSVDE